MLKKSSIKSKFLEVHAENSWLFYRNFENFLVLCGWQYSKYDYMREKKSNPKLCKIFCSNHFDLSKISFKAQEVILISFRFCVLVQTFKGAINIRNLESLCLIFFLLFGTHSWSQLACECDSRTLKNRVQWNRLLHVAKLEYLL